MSQHIFRSVTSERVPVRVLAGWDRPLQGFFLVIERTDLIADASDKDRYLFSNLDLPLDQTHPKTFTAFIEVLNKLGVVLPDSLLGALYADKERNAGNGQTLWGSKQTDL